MHVNLNIAYNDLVSIVKQLPLSDLERLNYTISNELVTKKKTNNSTLQSLILKAPTWSDKEYNDHQTIREHINKSRLS
jgi:hypothetical protein